MPWDADDVAGDLIAKVEELVELNYNQKQQLASDMQAKLEKWREAVYDDAYETGQDDKLPAFERVGQGTLDNLETGLTLLKKGDAQAEVYLDRALQDFDSGYVGGRFL